MSQRTNGRNIPNNNGSSSQTTNGHNRRNINGSSSQTTNGHNIPNINSSMSHITNGRKGPNTDRRKSHITNDRVSPISTTHNRFPSYLKRSVFKSCLGSNDTNLVKPPIINGDPPPHPATSFRNFGSKEETFFDSQAWLESDCDDDFMSVNGEFTPSNSRGNTPVHHKFSNKHEASPNGSEKKMRLSDLFKDSLRGNYEFEKDDEEEAVNKNGKVVESPIVQGDNVNAYGLKTKRMQGCFPSLLYTRSSSKKMMSPNPNPNPNPVVG
ncbi:unnamed protein product [Lactuca virosa]|uniref:Uncharacterized protein n=1 Tax=Lactuca virosa TaxID=75947 RepID=A0AAU9M1K5_9ASTR|nr:unnamed protein product [Lactuca virosa]